MSCTAGGQTCLFPPEETPDPLLCWLWLAHTMGPGQLPCRTGAGCFWRPAGSLGGPAQRGVPPGGGSRGRPAGGAAGQYAGGTAPVVLRCQKRGVRILPFDDPDYPLALARIPDMPLVLYCTGDTAWLNQPGAVGMVGSRRPTEYGLQAAEILGRGLAQGGAVIVSGLADGLDSASHRAAVSAGCPTIGVLGVPIDRTYPAANTGLRRSIEQCGCVISEYAPGEESVGRYGFLQRNRLIAALGSALVVMEAREKSGTMSTVAHAERYGKPVFAVPGSIFSPHSAGTNRLLQSGRAKAVCTAADLLAALGLLQGDPPPQAPGCAGTNGGDRAPGAVLYRAGTPRRGGAGRAQRPAHGGAAGQPDASGAVRPGALSARQAVCPALMQRIA